MPKEVSGLAASIRSSQESETFDFAGANLATIEHTIRDAFTEPFVGLSKHGMIRLTFIVGAGKLGRARYDDNAAKTVTATLREIGFVEDRGASAVVECAGAFKLQHDTGKNLKTVVVFPKLQAENEQDTLGGQEKVKPIIEEGSIEHKIAFASINVFQKMVSSRCPSWTELKGCIAMLSHIKDRAIALDSKLVQGQPLTDAEQDFYDSVSVTSLESKLSHTRDLMHGMVEDEKITENEKQQILGQVGERIQSLQKDIKEAQEKNNTKKQANLEAALEKVKARKAKVQACTPIDPLPLKHEPEIAKLRKELAPLLEMEDAAKGRLLTLKESQAIGRKDEILQEIQELENASKGWFESDQDFAIRVKASQRTWQSQLKNQKKKKVAAAPPGTGRSTAAPATKWVTPGARKPGGAWGANKPKKTAAPKAGGLFAAMMEDSSDSD